MERGSPFAAAVATIGTIAWLMRRRKAKRERQQRIASFLQAGGHTGDAAGIPGSFDGGVGCFLNSMCSGPDFICMDTTLLKLQQNGSKREAEFYAEHTRRVDARVDVDCAVAKFLPRYCGARNLNGGGA